MVLEWLEGLRMRRKCVFGREQCRKGGRIGSGGGKAAASKATPQLQAVPKQCWSGLLPPAGQAAAPPRLEGGSGLTPPGSSLGVRAGASNKLSVQGIGDRTEVMG